MRSKATTNKFVKIVGKGHANCLTQCIRDTWGRESFCDVTFICKNGKDQKGHNGHPHLKASKVVLAAASKKWASLLIDSENDVTIILPDWQFTSLKVLLQYIYTGEVFVNHLLMKEFEAVLSDWDIVTPEIVPVPEMPNYLASLPLGHPTASLSSTETTQQCPGDGGLGEEGSVSTGEFPVDKLPPLPNPPRNTIQDQAPNHLPSAVFDGKLQQSNIPSEKSSEKYVFLATYLKNCRGGDDPTAVPKTKKRTKRKDDESVTSDEETGFLRGQLLDKYIAQKPSEPVSRGAHRVEEDSESDKLDWHHALKLLREGKQRQQKLMNTVDIMAGSIQRHKDYLRHFFGYEYDESKDIKQSDVRVPCETCGKIVHRDYMSQHVAIHSDSRPYLCDQCGQTFALQDRLRKHLRYTHPDESQLEMHTCDVCQKTFKKASYLQRHMTLHLGLKPYSCPYCDKTFRLPNVLLKHKRIHTGEKPYECETCHRRFGARSNYVTHLRTHRKRNLVLNDVGSQASGFVDPETQLLKCDICGTSFHREYAFLIHRAAHKGEEPKLPCRHCTETFATHKLLKEHSRDRHADTLFQCDQCPSMFINKTTLNAHSLIHTQGKQFSCDLCAREFQTKVQLYSHRKNVHSNERPFHCRFCESRFKSKLTQRQHERIHTGERPYLCPHCPKAFRQDVHLANHIRLHTGEKPFVCTYCDKAFSHKNNLQIHVKIHTGERNQCGVCGQVFRSLIKLHAHESTHTPLDDKEAAEGGFIEKELSSVPSPSQQNQVS